MFILLGRDGRPYESATAGSLGGHRRGRLYGRLDCPAALRALARGGYKAHRVFFADEETAVAAGYRPCAVCLPEQYRRRKRRGTGITVGLEFRAPFTSAPLFNALRSHAVDGLERFDAGAGTHTRLIGAPHGPALVSVTVDAASNQVQARIEPAHPEDVTAVTATIRGWLDLDADPVPIDAALSADPLLEPLVARRPGLRVLGCTDGFETAVLTVLGQQVSLAAARTFGARLVAAFGSETDHAGFRAFPTPQTLAARDPETLRAAVGLTAARAHTVTALAAAAADGLELHSGLELHAGLELHSGLELHAGVDPGEFRRRLIALPGIGPWTADYLAVRVLGDRDAYPADDLVLRRALGVSTGKQARACAEAWRPWRAYALVHLWTQDMFSV